MKTPFLMLLAALPLGGCISFGAKPPPSLLTLDAAVPPAVGQVQNSATVRSITVQVPATPAAIAVTRIPVHQTANEIAYVPKAQWAEPPARLFARLLSDTLTARGGMVVLSTIESISDPSAKLGGELRDFGIDAVARQAVVTYDASLTRAGQERIEKRRFQAMVPVTAIDAANSGAAINQAANQVAGEVSAWVAGG